MSRGLGRTERTILRSARRPSRLSPPIPRKADLPGACRAAALARCGSNSVAGADGNGGALDALNAKLPTAPRSR
jgi:hypothetical protein